MVSAPVRREQVAYARGRAASRSRLACALLQVSRSTLALREPHGAAGDAPLIDRMKALALENNERIRLPAGSGPPGARGHRAQLGHELTGCGVRPGCSLPRRRPRRRVPTGQEPRPLATGRAERGLGLRLRVRSVRERGADEVLDGRGRREPGRPGDRGGGSHPSPRVIEVLSRLVGERGAPRYLRSDNGPEFVAAPCWIGSGARASRRRRSIPGSPGRTGRRRASTVGFATSA